jgi:hypothetical protein
MPSVLVLHYTEKYILIFRIFFPAKESKKEVSIGLEAA